MMEENLFQCDICGALVKTVQGSPSIIKCCNEDMIKIVPKTGDLASENHLPFRLTEGERSFRTGKYAHPMVKAHYIDFMQAVFGDYVFTQFFAPYEDIEFELPSSFKGMVKIFSHCFIHGLFEYVYEI